MTVNVAREESRLTLTLVGRLDTSTAPTLEEEINKNIEGAKLLCLDFTGLEYISSAGLRVILATQKQMNKQGKMVLRGVNETVMEVFEITGFADILTIE